MAEYWDGKKWTGKPAPRLGTCQWCHKGFTLTPQGMIPGHRNPGDAYECLGSLQLCEQDRDRIDKLLGGTKT